MPIRITLETEEFDLLVQMLELDRRSSACDRDLRDRLGDLLRSIDLHAEGAADEVVTEKHPAPPQSAPSFSAWFNPAQLRCPDGRVPGSTQVLIPIDEALRVAGRACQEAAAHLMRERLRQEKRSARRSKKAEVRDG